MTDERLQIENRYRAGAAVGREAAIELGRESDVVDSVCIGNFAHNFFRVHVKDDDFRLARDKETTSGRVESKDVPAAVAAELIFLSKW